MFLEPIYLNENMLLNCASYLFGGVILNEEKTTQNNNEDMTKGSISGGGKLGINMFSNLVNTNADLVLEHNRQKNLATETKGASQIALGSIHQSVLEELDIRSFICNLNNDHIVDYVNDNKYVRLQANLVPVDYFAMLQILKMIVPQLGNIFDLFGSSLLNNNKNTKDKRKLNEKKENIINSFSLISNLVDQLENTYLESKQLEMLIIDERSKKTIGVVDIDIASHNPNEMKAKLTDGNFVIIGKVTKFADEGDSINLLQRSLLSTIIEKIEIILKFIDEKSSNSSSKSLEQWLGHKESILPLLDKLFMNEIKGKSFRIKAMSVCV